MMIIALEVYLSVICVCMILETMSPNYCCQWVYIHFALFCDVIHRAPKTEPCGTPQLASRDSEKTLFTHTLLSLLLKNDSNHWSTVPSTPYKWLNLRIHIVWSTVSKAAERSSELRTVHLPASRPSMMWLWILRIAVSVECCDR